MEKNIYHLKLSHIRHIIKEQKLKRCRQEQIYTIKDNNIVSDKGARIKLKITRPTHTSQSSLGVLTTADKMLNGLIII